LPSKLYDSPVDQLEKIDHSAYTDSKAFIKPEALINAIHELHELLVAYYRRFYKNLCRNQREALSDCLQALRKEFLFGVLTSLRAHTTDSESYRRKAVEFCAFAIVILRSPQNAKVWLEAVQSNNKYNRYKSTFSLMAILKEVSDTGIKLSLLYDQLCKEVHASPFAIKTQTRIYEKDGNRMNYLTYHDDSTESDQYALAQRFATGIEMDFFILVTLGGGIEMRFPELDMKEWKNKIDQVAALLAQEKERIKNLSSVETKT